MLHASVDLQRVLGRLRRSSNPQDPATTVTHLQARSLAATRTMCARVGAAAVSAHLAPRSRRPSARAVGSLPSISAARILGALGHDRAIAIVVAGIVVGASAISFAPTSSPGDTGGPIGDGAATRVAVGGDVVGLTDVLGTVREADPVLRPVQLPVLDTEPAPNVSAASEAGTIDGAAIAEAPEVEGPFLADGTLLKPVAVDTTVADGRALVKTYKVKAGDSLASIAKRHGVSTMSVWWANDLKDLSDIKRGQELRIPPVSGLIIKVRVSDTLDGLAKRHKVDAAEIVKLNGLEDPNLVVGQVLIMPGAKGKPLPTPKPKPAPQSNGGGSSGGGSGGGSGRPPASYSGGSFAWPAPGGSISQRYRGGHYGLDIDGETGDPIVAAAGGTVIFSGWKSNGGGYQVWIAHGSGLYTTYNHMSSVSVGNGQSVGKGQRVGRMGATGFASGSHLHFEVWRGPIWNGGTRVNPLGYL